MIRFGQKIRCGNFVLLFYTKGLNGASQAELRKYLGVSKQEARMMQRKTLPYLKISDVGGLWSVDLSAAIPFFSAVVELLNKEGRLSKEHSEKLLPYLDMMYADTTIFTDAEYAADKFKALEAMLARHAKPTDEGKDEEAIKDVKERIEGRAKLEEMRKFIEEHPDLTKEDERLL